MSHNQTAAVMDVENSFSAQGSRGHEWLMDVRRLVAAITVNFTLPMEVHVQGFMAETIDRADTAFRLGFVVFVAMGAVAFAIQVRNRAADSECQRMRGLNEKDYQCKMFHRASSFG